MKIALLYLIPLVTGALCFMPKGLQWPGRIQIIGMLLLLGVIASLGMDVYHQGPWHGFRDWIHIDALSVLLLIIVGIVSLLVAIYASGYMTNDVEEKVPHPLKLKGFYGVMNLFIISMLVMVTTNNLGIFWISIEASTLFSAFLVGFYNKKETVEAAWKYIILCAVGIAFALIGLTLGYYAVIEAGLDETRALNIDYLVSMASHLDPNLMKVAFIFVLIGFGTKAGFAPLHNWLPDAYSEAPAPISALLSGALCKCVIYGIIRYSIITNTAVGAHFANQLLLFFGLFSLAVAAPFILVQRNTKRLFAYSSLEHIGIIAVGLGFGTPLAVFGALFHMLNHALIKSTMFFVAGNLGLKYRSRKMSQTQGVIEILPIGGVVLLLGGLALAGSPPFSTFLSEFYIISGGLQTGLWKETVLFIGLLIVIFGGLSYHLIQMAIGPTPIPNFAGRPIPKGEINRSSIVAFTIPLMLALILGLWQPVFLLNLLHAAERIINGGLPS